MGKISYCENSELFLNACARELRAPLRCQIERAA